MTKKQTTTILKVQSSDFLKKKKTWKYKDALIVTMLTLGGIYAVFFTLILIENSDAVINLFQAQALLGGLFVNLCAVISVAYSKFAKEILVHRNVYWLSLASFVIIIAIFAQARVMCDNQMSFIFFLVRKSIGVCYFANFIRYFNICDSSSKRIKYTCKL